MSTRSTFRNSRLIQLLAAAVAAATIGACTSPRTVDPFTQRFVGRWFVGQLSHALMEATIYEFAADGTIQRLGTLGDHVASDFETGTVANPPLSCHNYDTWCDEDLVCRLGGRWSALGEQRLKVSGICNDGVQRDIILDLVSIGTGDTSYEAQIVEVANETGWVHPGFEWAWCKCEPAPCDAFGY
jgi:hypothetical protein